MIEIKHAFLLYARASIEYAGRAKSSLEEGNYLIIRKNDGTLMIHGASLLTARNYQPAGARMTFGNNQFISIRKNEKIIITIHESIHYYEPQDWSICRPQMSMTERQLCKQITIKIEELLEDKILQVIPEYMTPYGPIDLLAINSENLHHVIEVKRGRAAISSCTQVKRYMQYLQEINKKVKGWVMSPAISSKALNYLNKNSLHWKQVHH